MRPRRWLAALAVLALGPNVALADRNARAGQAEIERVIADIHGVVRHEYGLGSEIEFWLWTGRGAITVVSMAWSQRGSQRGVAIALASLERTLEPSLSVFIGAHERYLRVRLRRDRARWRAVAIAGVNPAEQTDMPVGLPTGLPADGAPEGRSIPLPESASQTPTIRRATDSLAREVIKLASVPAGGESEHRIVVAFDDARVTAWKPASYAVIRSKRQARTLTVSGWSAAILANALVPLARGLGPRQVEVVLRARHRAGSATAGWQLVRAGVVRGRERKDEFAAEFAAIVREYRQTHEQIIADWHSNMRSAAVKTASFTVEQVALWVVGGWLFKAASAGLRPLAPRLIGILRGASKSRPTGAAEYLETMLWRLPNRDRDAVKLLMGKAETQGMDALSAAEHAQLQRLLERMEGLIGKRLTGREKDRLRYAMKRRFDEVHPGVKQAFADAGLFKTNKQIHHRIPLEWAHRTPALDINGPGNLAMVHGNVHKALNALWTRFRTAPTGKVTEHHVKRVADIADRHFKHWYNKPPAQPGWEKAAEAAKAKALAEVDALIASIAHAGR